MSRYTCTARVCPYRNARHTACVGGAEGEAQGVQESCRNLRAADLRVHRRVERHVHQHDVVRADQIHAESARTGGEQEALCPRLPVAVEGRDRLRTRAQVAGAFDDDGTVS